MQGKIFIKVPYSFMKAIKNAILSTFWASLVGREKGGYILIKEKLCILQGIFEVQIEVSQYLKRRGQERASNLVKDRD